MSITATNRIKTERGAEVVINLHTDHIRKSVTMTIYTSGMQSTVFMDIKEARELQNALDRTNREIDEETN